MSAPGSAAKRLTHFSQTKLGESQVEAAARDAPIGRPGGRAMSNAQLLLTNVSVKLHHERR